MSSADPMFDLMALLLEAQMMCWLNVGCSSRTSSVPRKIATKQSNALIEFLFAFREHDHVQRKCLRAVGNRHILSSGLPSPAPRRTGGFAGRLTARCEAHSSGVLNMVDQCTCGKPWWGIYPPPPCPEHAFTPEPIRIPSADLPVWVVPMDRKPWECPRCRAINGPYVDKCGCAPIVCPVSMPPGDSTGTPAPAQIGDVP